MSPNDQRGAKASQNEPKKSKMRPNMTQNNSNQTKSTQIEPKQDPN